VEEEIKLALNTRETLEKTLESCTGCQACSSDCHLLEELGGLAPYEIAEQVLSGQVSEKVLHFISRCSLCGLCTRYCPEEADIPAMVIAARQLLAERGITDLQLYRAMWVDHDWNGFTIYRDTYQIDYSDLIKTRCDTLFFPGCALSSYAPELTRATIGWLAEQGGETGLLLMCCGLPLVQIGAAERAKRYMKRLWQAVSEKKAYRIVTACPMCYYHLQHSEARGEIEVVSLYKLMADAGVSAPALGSSKLTIHDSCPDREGKEGKYVHQILSKHEMVEMAHSGAVTICCGSGGIVSMIDPGLCTQRAEARLAEFHDVGADMCATYCMACAHRLSRVAGPGKVRHLLELVFNQPLDYAQIQYRTEAMWQDQWGEYNIHRLENSRLQES